MRGITPSPILRPDPVGSVYSCVKHLMKMLSFVWKKKEFTPTQKISILFSHLYLLRHNG